MAFVTVIPKQSRAAGTHRQNFQSVPGGTTRVNLRALMDPADINDGSLVLHYGVEGSSDGTNVSVVVADANWQGNTVNRDGVVVAPVQGVQTSPMPAFLRVVVTLPRTVSIGLDAEVL